jgi:telomerase reverse transcriptase
LYFAKVDVKSCFDTVPQDKVLPLVHRLIKADSYVVNNTAQVRPPLIVARREGTSLLRPRVRFESRGQPCKKVISIRDEAEQRAQSNRVGSVFVGTIGQQTKTKDALLRLLSEHIKGNVVKIGKKFYRQKQGIPQGSIVSSLLCNLFYSTLETGSLAFAARPDTFLMRLIDDFLLISTDKPTAIKFLEVMHAGLPDFGIEVKREKSLANFTLGLDGGRVPLMKGNNFPYCGTLIETRTLNISKDMARSSLQGKKIMNQGPFSKDPTNQSTGIADSLTVETSTLPGKAIRQKAIRYVL